MAARGGKKRPGEFKLIARYFRPLAADPGAFALLDDAALLSPPGESELVVTVDTVAAGVHFFENDPPESIARKALRVNLSDLAAKGASPFGYFLSLALPKDWTERWVRAFARALGEDQLHYRISLLGGDTTRASGGLTVSITALGTVPRGGMVLRAGARPGDAVFVSGTVGDSALGLALRNGKIEAPRKEAAFLRDRYLHPEPRLALAPVVRRYATSAMDVSDGLVGDLAHICEASGVGATIEVRRLPLSEAAHAVVGRSRKRLASVLTGGDDYEILATVRSRNIGRFVADAYEAGVPVSRIGRIERGKGPPVVIGLDGKRLRLADLGHTHF